MKTDEISKPLETLLDIEEKEAGRSKNPNLSNWLIKVKNQLAETATLDELIARLQVLIHKNDSDLDAVKLPYYNLLIAYANYYNNQPALSESPAKASEREFLNRGKYQQAVISGWFLALLWCEMGELEAADERMGAVNKIISKHHHHDFESGHYFPDDKDLKETIKTSYEKTRKEHENTKPGKGIDPKDSSRNSKPSSSSAARGKQDVSSSIATVNAGSQPFYLTIPLDPKTPESIELLKRCRDLLDQQINQKTSPQPKTAINVIQAPAVPEQILIPAFPLYGPVAAGPDGEPHLHPTDEIFDPVYESHKLNIHGESHQVTLFLKKIAADDGKKYGWLQVSGRSMDAATDTPIRNNDFILFREIIDLKTFANRIVIGELADNATQPPQVLVKRLIKKDEKFFLRSESSLDEPRYKKEIEILRGDQVRGVVVAIASPNPQA